MKKKLGRPLNPIYFDIVICKNCGKEIRNYKSTAKAHRNDRIFCSKKCRYTYVRKDQFCLTCHKPLSSPKSHRRMFCSRKCYSDSKKLKAGEAHKHEVISGYKHHAEKRGVEFNLSLDKINELFSSDCYWCGAKPENGKNSSRIKRSNGITIYNGIDRIDSNLGYTENNCVSSCIKCNSMKREYSKEEFLDRVKRISVRWNL